MYNQHPRRRVHPGADLHPALLVFFEQTCYAEQKSPGIDRSAHHGNQHLSGKRNA